LSIVGVDRSFKQLWKSKIPLKIKIWLWLIRHNAIATKDNMKRSDWVGSFVCQFGPSDESINHLFFICPMATYMWSTISIVLGVYSRPSCFTQYFWWISKILPLGFNFHVVGIAALCWAIWKTRKTFFKGKLISSPMSMICYMCSFLRYWAGLQCGVITAHDIARSSMVCIQHLQNNSVEDEDEDATVD
jgi:hypothetical protein